MSNIFVDDKLTMASTQSDKSLKRLEVFLRPTEKNELFRFRLLWFKAPNSTRKVPYIERWIHQVWEDGDNGKKKLSEIICPISKHVAENWPGNPYDDCPICKFTNLNLVTAKDSKWTDKVANANFRTFKRKYDLVVPVYIVSDPVYPGNNGKIRVFRINDSKVGEKFKQLIVSKRAETQIFNGGKSPDFLIRMDKVPYTNKDGSTWMKNEIVQMGFTTKAYEIGGITADAIEAFPFDDYFGAVPTMQDLKDWHKAHCLHASTDDIDFDGLSDMTVEAKKPAPVEKKVEVPEVDELEADLDNVGLTTPAKDSPVVDSDPFDGLPDELKDDAPEMTNVEAKPAKKAAPATDDIDIDAILAKAGFGGDEEEIPF